jgi:hypothetical protein
MRIIVNQKTEKWCVRIWTELAERDFVLCVVVITGSCM